MPSSTSAIGRTGSPSPSNARLRRPRLRVGSSWIETPGANTACPSLSIRKLDLRATELPVIAPMKWPSRVVATRGSNRTGILPAATLTGLSRATARSPGAAADRGGILQVGGEARAVPGIVALHARSGAGDDAGRAAVAGGAIAAGEAARDGHRDGRSRGRGARAARIGDALDRQRGTFRFQRAGLQRRRIGLDRVPAVEIGERRLGEQLGGGEPGIGILGRFGGHRQRALDQDRRAHRATGRTRRRWPSGCRGTRAGRGLRFPSGGHPPARPCGPAPRSTIRRDRGRRRHRPRRGRPVRPVVRLCRGLVRRSTWWRG